jgi:hypothetical protein
MDSSLPRFILAVLLSAFLSSCSDEPTGPKPATGPGQLVVYIFGAIAGLDDVAECHRVITEEVRRVCVEMSRAPERVKRDTAPTDEERPWQTSADLAQATTNSFGDGKAAEGEPGRYQKHD